MSLVSDVGYGSHNTLPQGEIVTRLDPLHRPFMGTGMNLDVRLGKSTINVRSSVERDGHMAHIRRHI